uniref:Putative secreted protein n=1 Tax=Anopheles darlingi TaxID=43151 RepID=A0A2M4DHY0_ANODA
MWIFFTILPASLMAAQAYHPSSPLDTCFSVRPPVSSNSITLLLGGWTVEEWPGVATVDTVASSPISCCCCWCCSSASSSDAALRRLRSSNRCFCSNSLRSATRRDGY